MSLNAFETKEAVTTLRDRLKHGQNMTKILESQLDTAQQNISLLQGQVRLANETILNLKKYFTETENTLNELLVPNHASSRVFRFDNEHKDHLNELSQKHGNVDSTTRSPLPQHVPADTISNGELHKRHEDKRENHNKSPYAQQLRQVLDVLQDEEPRKALGTKHRHHQEISSQKNCACADCLSHAHSRSKRYHDSEYVSKTSSGEGDYGKQKYKGNVHSPDVNVSPKSFQRSGHNDSMHGQPSYSNHCNGPCCSNEGNYKILEKSPHYHENDKAIHYFEKSPTSMHYINVNSPGISEGSSKHSGERHHGHHCNDKCSCRSTPGYMPAYVPYGYHLMENPHGIPHDAMQSMSPNARRKRSYIPLIPNEEPPHLKYTKVKRIDGSKLTAQKVLQDFTKRRFIAYNPRYDLDLLIVPPPIPAIDLLKENNAHCTLRAKIPKTNDQVHGEIRTMKQDKSESSPLDEEENRKINKNKNNDDSLDKGEEHDVDINDNNNNSTNLHSSHNLYSPSKGVATVLPSIKEEPRSKLEDHINKLRNEQHSKASYYKKGGKNNSGYTNKANDDNNNNSDSNTIGGIMNQSNLNSISIGERNGALHEQLSR